MKIGRISHQKWNLLKESYIIRVYDNNTFKKCYSGSANELAKELRKKENLKFSENIFLSDLFGADLIKEFVNNYIFL